MFNYRLYYLADSDDMNEKKYSSENEVEIGDIIQLDCGFYYMVINVKQQKTGICLELSKSAQDEKECELLAKQYEFIG
ncbi:hypothetical protein [Aeromonas enteropelogenes]|uniref:hypothetical protein n=1 Tax=Aeromonas enteropelogenes TaxID=29489 RepID=UPI003BA08837